MAISISNSYATDSSLNALNRSSGDLTNSIGRIATGRRINSASDDAVGLIIADGLNSRARAMGQEIQNLNDDIARIQIQDGALGNAVDIIQGIREKAVQAIGDSQTTETRAAIQADVSESLKSLDNLYQNTTFGDLQLLSDKPGLNALQGIDLTTGEGAEAALETIDSALGDVLAYRSELGSRQNQAASQIFNLRDTYVATRSSESQIRDVDFAEEVMNMNKIETLRKANILALGKAKVHRQSVMDLLG